MVIYFYGGLILDYSGLYFVINDFTFPRTEVSQMRGSIVFKSIAN